MPTLVPIATYVIPSSTSSYTFSNIPQTYTDLQIRGKAFANTYDDIFIEFNGDTGSNYSYTQMYAASNSTTASVRGTTAAAVAIESNAKWGTFIIDIQGYSQTTAYKPYFGMSGATAGASTHYSGRWRSTSAITSIKLRNSGTFSAETVFTIYGILAA